MSKNLNVNATINIHGNTKELVKDVKDVAKDIEKELSNATTNGLKGLKVKDLRDMAATINAMFNKMGQAAPLDIEKNFKGKGNAADRIKLLSEALDKLFDSLGNVNNAFDGNGLDNGLKNLTKGAKKSVTDLDKIKEKIAGFYNAILAEADAGKLNKIKDSLKRALSLTDEEFSKFNDIFKGLEVGTIEEDDAIKQIDDAVKRINAAKKKAYDALQGDDQKPTISYKKVNSEIKEFVSLVKQSDEPGVSMDRLDALDEKIEKIKQSIVDLADTEDDIKNVKKLMNDLAFGKFDSDSAMEQLCDIFKIEIPESVKIASVKVQEFLNLAKLYNDIEYMSKPDADAAIQKLEELNNELLMLSQRGDITEKNMISVYDALVKAQQHLENMDHSGHSGLGDSHKELIQQKQELEIVEDATRDVNGEFEKLVNYISKSGQSPNTFFKDLASGAKLLDEELENILDSLYLLNDDGSVNLLPIKSGFSNTGGMISDEHVLIARDDKKLKYSLEAQQKTLNAKAMGANIGAVLEVYHDEVNNLVYELQNKIEGKGILDFKKGIVNTEFLEATDEQIQKLINDLLILQKTGLYIDWNGDNIVYDKENGFSFFDFFTAPYQSGHITAHEDNTVQENLNMFFDKIFNSLSMDPASVPIAAAFKDEVMNMVPVVQDKKNKILQDVSKYIDMSLEKEETAHEENTDAINAENKALEAQIELKKKAQSMKWESFALDESLSGLKTEANLYTLADMERFWKKSNYEKQIDFFEMEKKDSDKLIADTIPHDMLQGWYEDRRFPLKSKIENIILANDELRNAAVNKLYQIFKEYVDSSMEFEEFINKEFTVFRGKPDGSIVFGEEDKLSFSFKESTADSFAHGNDQILIGKIKPKNTVGNAGVNNNHQYSDGTYPGFYDGEVETFISNEYIDLIDPKKSFKDYYNDLTPTLQAELNTRLVNLEKQRVAALLEDGLTTLVRNAYDSSYDFKDLISNQFAEGKIPKSIMSSNDYDFDSFADAYNNLSEMQQKLVAYYAHLNSLTGGKVASSSSVKLKQSDLISHLIYDTTGAQSHVAQLTGEHKFNLFGAGVQDIKSEITVHQKNTQAIKEEAQAQQDLNSTKLTHIDVATKLNNSLVSANGAKFHDLASLYHHLNAVDDADDNYLKQGSYKVFGETLEAKDLFNTVEQIEQKYNENLGYVKNYLKQVYKNIDLQGETLQMPNIESEDDLEFDYLKAFKKIKQKKHQALISKTDIPIDNLYDLMSDIENVKYSYDTQPSMIKQGEYLESNGVVGHYATDLFYTIKEIEEKYNEDLSAVTDYLKKVYSHIDFSDEIKEVTSDIDDDAIPFDDTIPFEYDDSVLKNTYKDAKYKLMKLKQDAIQNDADDKYDDFAGITDAIDSIKSSARHENLMVDGEYMDSDTGEILNAKDLFNTISEIEQKYNEDLSLIKVYLEKVYNHIDFSDEIKAVDFDDDLPILEIAKTAPSINYKGYLKAYKQLDRIESNEFLNDNIDKAYATGKIKEGIDSIQFTDSSYPLWDFNIGKYVDLYTNEDKYVAELADFIQKYEETFGENLSAVKNYLQQIYNGIDFSDKFKEAAADIDEFGFQEDFIEDVSDDDLNHLFGIKNVDTESKFQSSIDLDTDAIQNETLLIDGLVNKIKEVEQAVKNKTQAFEEEGITVSETVDKEIAALNDLSDLLDKIQNSLQIIFAANIQDFSAINFEQDPNSGNTAVNALHAIQQTLGQILSVLQGFTGIESDNKNALKYKEPVVDNGIENENFEHLINSLISAVDALKDVANGIVQHQKAQKGDTSDAVAKIANPNQYKQISDIAANSVGNLGSEVQIKSLKALADGIVKVEGAFKNAQGEWEGFIVNVNESNQAVDLAINKQSAFAKSLNETAEAVKNNNVATNSQYADTVTKAQGKYNNTKSYVQSYVDDGSQVVKQKLAEYANALNKLKVLQQTIDSGNFTEDDIAKFNLLTKECNNYASALSGIIDKSKKLKAEAVSESELLSGIDLSTNENIKAALTNYIKTIYDSGAAVSDFNEKTKELNFVLKNSDGTITKMTAAFDAAQTKIFLTAKKTGQATSQYKSFFSAIGDEFKKLGKYAIARFGIDEIMQQFRQGVQYIREIDAALTELKKVTSETDATYDRFLQTASKTAGVIGSTVAELTTMSAEWAKVGYSITEAAKLAESTAILLNVSEFEDAETASEALISTIQAFGYAAEDSMDVIDIMNEIGKFIACR